MHAECMVQKKRIMMLEDTFFVYIKVVFITVYAGTEQMQVCLGIVVLARDVKHKACHPHMAYQKLYIWLT